MKRTLMPEIFEDKAMESSLFEAAEIGVAVLRKYHRNLERIEEKGKSDLVTQADQESEAAVLEFLRKRHPDHVYVAEESWDLSLPDPEGFAWALDPLDGTTNYAHGLDHFAFSLGLLYDGQPVAGIIVDPTREDTYHAFKGRGAWRNHQRLSVSKTTELARSLIATGFPYDRTARINEITMTVRRYLLNCQAMRRYGVAAMDLALVAAGEFDGYYEAPIKVWDCAAGVLLVTEAGGKISNYEGDALNLFKPWVVASNGAIHEEMLDMIKLGRKDAMLLADVQI